MPMSAYLTFCTYGGPLVSAIAERTNKSDQKRDGAKEWYSLYRLVTFGSDMGNERRGKGNRGGKGK